MEPTIAYNPAPPVNPLDQQARILAIKNLMGQGQMQQQNIQAGNLENQQRQMDLSSQQALQKAYMEANGDPDKTTQLAAKYGAKPQALLQWQSSVLDQKMKTLDLVSKQGDIAKVQADAMQGAHDAVSQADAASKPIVYQQQLMGLKQRGIDVSQLPPQYPGDQQFALMGATVKTHSQMVDEALKNSEVQKNTAQAQDAAAGAQQKQLTIAGTSSTGVTADQQATLKQGQQRIGVEQGRLAEEKRHNQVSEGLTAAPGSGNGAADISQVPPLLRGQVQSILDYRQAMPPTGRNNPRNNMLQYWVNALDPTYDATTFPARNKVLNEYVKSAGNGPIGAINVALGHLGELNQAAKALDQDNIPLLHSIASKVGAAVGSDAASTYQMILHRVGPEMTAAYVQGGGGEGERGANQSDFDISKGAKQISSNIGESAKLLRSKLSSQENNWNNTFHPTKDADKFENRFITPSAKEALNTLSQQSPIGGGSMQVGQTVKLKSGKTVKVTAVHPDGSFDAQ